VDPYPDSMVSLDPYLDPDSLSESVSRRAKMTHKNRKKVDKKIYKSFRLYFFSFNFQSLKPWIRIGSGFT